MLMIFSRFYFIVVVVVVRSGEVVVVLTVICVDLFVAIFYEAFELQEFIITSFSVSHQAPLLSQSRKCCCCCCCCCCCFCYCR